MLSVVDRMIGNLSFYRSIILVMILLCSVPAHSHVGIIDADGCHNNADGSGQHCNHGIDSSGGSAGGFIVGLGSDAAFVGNFNVAQAIVALAAVGGLVVLSIYLTKQNSWSGQHNLALESAKPKLKIQPYLDGHQFGFQWSVPVHD